VLVALLLFRNSMFTGWWYIMRHGRRQKAEEESFPIVPMKRRTPAQKLESDNHRSAHYEKDTTLLGSGANGFPPGEAPLPQPSLSPDNEPNLIDLKGQNDSQRSESGTNNSLNSSPLRSNPPHAGLLPDTPNSRNFSAKPQGASEVNTPEPGDATTRHGTTTWFEETSSDDETERRPPPRMKFNDAV
jgi:hypothetical protein